MGEIVIRQENKDFTINIYNGNCLAVMLYEYKKDGKDMYSLYNFFMDTKHCRKLVKMGEELIFDEVVSISLNLSYPNAKKLLDIFVKQGYTVNCYYKTK